MNRKNNIKKVVAVAFAAVSAVVPFTSVCAVEGETPSTPPQSTTRVCPPAPKKERPEPQTDRNNLDGLRRRFKEIRRFFSTVNDLDELGRSSNET